jgi:hypothetical protein
MDVKHGGAMYAFRLKLGASTHTNDEVIYLGITFKQGLSTTICSEREEEQFRSNGMDVSRVPVESPEYDDLRKQLDNAALTIAQVKQQAEMYDARLVEGYQKQIAVLEAAVQQTVNERDAFQKQLILNAELIELRGEKKKGGR